MLANQRDDQYRNYMDEYSGVESRIQELINERRDLRKKIKDAGFNMKAFDAVRALIDESDERVINFWQDLSSGLVWMNRPIGFQPDLYEATVVTDPDLTEDQQRAIGASGHAAGLRGARRDENEWTPGSLAHALWDQGFLVGEKELQERLSGETQPEPRRGRGRPAGSLDSRPRAPRRRRAANGEAGEEATTH